MILFIQERHVPMFTYIVARVNKYRDVQIFSSMRFLFTSIFLHLPLLHCRAFKTSPQVLSLVNPLDIMWFQCSSCYLPHKIQNRVADGSDSTRLCPAYIEDYHSRWRWPLSSSPHVVWQHGLHCSACCRSGYLEQSSRLYLLCRHCWMR